MRESRLTAYGCGSPIRQPVVQALAQGAKADAYLPEKNPGYQGGDSLVWGLIRGAPQIMQATCANGHDYYQIDNAYFGRDLYYRVTKNAQQLTEIIERDSGRFEKIFSKIGFELMPWKQTREGPIVICLSTPFLFDFYSMKLEVWLEDVIAKIKRFTDRKIVIREKELAPSGIDDAIRDSWCVVTHVSAAALDALRLGIPVSTTGLCAASPLATPLAEIESPRMPQNREQLFASLAYGQFTMEEMISGFAWNTLAEAKPSVRPAT